VSRDWYAWYAAYDEPGSALDVRLRIVQRHIAAWLATVDGPARAVSACAGQGRDLLPVLAASPRGASVRARLVELDPANAAVARSLAAGLDAEVVVGDAGVTDAYLGAVPADLVLLCGIFGNVPEADIRRTVAALPMLCAPGATVIWTRHRKAPDLTPAVRSWVVDAGCAEVAFEGVAETSFVGVGVARFTGTPVPLEPGVRLFAFEP
jgi:hypothetical protein